MTINRDLVKSWCRIDIDADDDIIDMLISAAATKVEKDTGTSLIPQSVQKVCKNISKKIILTPHPVNSVESIMIGATDVSASFEIDLTVRPANVVLSNSLILNDGDELTINYTAGYETTPSLLELAQLSLIAFWYDNRNLIGTDSPDYQNKISPFVGLRLV